MTKQSMLRLTPEFRLLVERYQQANQIETLTGALYELISRGYANWQFDTDAGWTETQEQEDALFQAFDAQSDEKWFALWFARRYSPKHGGKREGSGRRVKS